MSDHLGDLTLEQELFCSLVQAFFHSCVLQEDIMSGNSDHHYLKDYTFRASVEVYTKRHVTETCHFTGPLAMIPAKQDHYSWSPSQLSHMT